ncbi:hypothetical protein DFH09DRAFT_457808 [Mycena vulgaris]|nr:hypothetical protein DFH09DRAFT_457808 [Mycena vulgaris]
MANLLFVLLVKLVPLGWNKVHDRAHSRGHPRYYSPNLSYLDIALLLVLCLRVAAGADQKELREWLHNDRTAPENVESKTPILQANVSDSTV